jgi:hypothetical protein
MITAVITVQTVITVQHSIRRPPITGITRHG